MPLLALDHVNLRTSRVEELSAFYCDILGFRRGARPAFGFGGAWLYCGDRPVVHLVATPGGAAVPEPPAAASTLRLSHFAFRATGMADFLARLREAQIPYRLGRLPGMDVTQVNLVDPDGNALHVDFAGEGDGSSGDP
jgi:catechol 2,3-dioxygenase-like lactoylglutathione lyase family enzyme